MTAEHDRAVRVVAAAAHDATDLRDLLDMLGLNASDEPEPPTGADRAAGNRRLAVRLLADVGAHLPGRSA
ncbi:hypothetical protein [Actinokineospora sp. NBRC 105648]|uniref:hypothetical protein n=1 Tax=Actinokineospora sp. NBRC 105648 TaxID=3032206 RepID=UPI0024A54F3D|nr:hypothetical protein [Actinokineospora sp. NBRC 105648]GLZ36685.1 hypothetical protein Acsp05_03100 [Actinokineospora sp. NBRC 105648]